MTDQIEPGIAPVTDHRPAPRGVLPRRIQAWLMAGLALGIVLVILLAGQPEPSVKPAVTSGEPPAPNPDRLRDFQDRLRALQGAALQPEEAPPAPPAEPTYVEAAPPSREDPIVAERRRREYESLFASNVVLSRRPDAQRPDSGAAWSSHIDASPALREAAGPSVDEVAEAVIRATARAGGVVTGDGAIAAASPKPAAAGKRSAGHADARPTPSRTGAISAAAPLHRVLEGTLIDAVLTNRLDGSAAAPINCLVTNPVYSHSGQHVLIPGGARLLGETRPVQALGDTRLAVAFHRLVMPDGRTYPLDLMPGLNQIGDAGLRDRVNHHYWSMFGAAGAVGLITGLAQWVGTAGLSRGSGDRTVIIAGGADAASQASSQVMSRFLNRLPTVTIREGHRVRVYLTSDIELPAYEAR